MNKKFDPGHIRSLIKMPDVKPPVSFLENVMQFVTLSNACMVNHFRKSDNDAGVHRYLSRSVYLLS